MLADEVSDCSNPEQLSLFVRYVDSDCVIRGEFLDFLHCDIRLSGKALAETVLGGLINLGLDMMSKTMMDQFLDILMGYVHIFGKLTVK